MGGVKMRNIARIWLSIVLIIGLVGCSSKPPKYNNNETAEAYGEKVGAYYGKKLKEAGAKNIRKYLKKSKEVMNNSLQNIQKLNKKQAVEQVDDAVEQLIDLSDEYLGITEDDYEFFVNPLKYYDIYDDYSNLTQRTIGDIGQEMWEVLDELIERAYGEELYSPFELQSLLKEKLLKNGDEEKYYYILQNSKYKKFIADNDWIKEYTTKRNILEKAKKIAKENGLYFNANKELLKDLNSKIKKLQSKIEKLQSFDSFSSSFNIITKNSAIVSTLDMTLDKLKKIVDSKGKEAFRNNYFPINDVKSHLKSAKDHLKEAKEQGRVDAVKKYTIKVERYTEELKQVNKEFEELYQNDINVLNSKIQQLEPLKQKLKSLKQNYNDIAKKYNNNIKIFIVTYKKLLADGYEESDLAKYLTGGEYVTDVMDLKNYNISNVSKNILKGFDNIGFNHYMKVMKTILK